MSDSSTNAVRTHAVIRSAAGYSAGIDSDREFTVTANAREHSAAVSGPNGNYIFDVGQAGEIRTAEGVEVTADEEALAAKDRGQDKARGARTIRTPEGQTFRIEDAPRHMNPAGVYYD